jgi:hypothetical protein
LALSQSENEFHCGAAIASAADGKLLIQRNGATAVEAIWAAAHVAWWTADHGLTLDVTDALDQLGG